MCGICGVIDLGLNSVKNNQWAQLVQRMTNKLYHRGPDDIGQYDGENANFGISRLAITDLQDGQQPFYNEDKSIVMVCNGEINNYIELRKELISKGHKFKSNCDVEVIIHLYEEYGEQSFTKLNGQFAFVLYDIKKCSFILARDRFGIAPLYYTILNNVFIFGSEIKAILEYEGIPRKLDLIGLDQIITLPGLVSPRTMFKDIHSLENGHYLKINTSGIKKIQYWDLTYPMETDLETCKEEYQYSETLYELLSQSIKIRSRADVPIAFYSSGGLDSSLISSLYRRMNPSDIMDTFSVNFSNKQYSENKYQECMSKYINSIQHSINFSTQDVFKYLEDVIYHCECPLKETYNTASLALSKKVRESNYKVVLSGEGSDELFAGYPSYKFDLFRTKNQILNEKKELDLRIQNEVWGDPNFIYEHSFTSLEDIKKRLYSKSLLTNIQEFNCLKHPIINKEQITGRHIIHKRSYIDFKLRLVDHLVSDHGDRMGLANSVEMRFPYLDNQLVDYVVQIPPYLLLKDYKEKYILNQMAKSKQLLPDEILKREKFAFVAPGSPELLKVDQGLLKELLSYEEIKRQGIFNPAFIESLVHKYEKGNTQFLPHYEIDLLTIVVTTTILVRKFGLSI